MIQSFKTRGVCAREIIVETENDIIKSVKFIGGCEGNHLGIAALCENQKISDVAKRLEGIDCGGRGTSCPDQLSKALKQLL
ncbi:MAG: TIGR03905 family TSCPD domain-containing protein [Oscillospiraceae bacterium]